MPLSQSVTPATKKIVMPQRRDHIIKQARERIARIRASLDAMDYLCSGTLLRRMKMLRQTRLPLAPRTPAHVTARITNGDT